MSRRTTSVYDAGGRQTQRIDPRGITTTYTYNLTDQLTGRHYPVDPPVTFAYDELNQRTLVQDSHGRTTFSYDPLGRTTQMVDFANRRITYSYDAVGQRTVLAAPGTGRFTSSYDAAGRLTRLINPQGRVTTFQYDTAGRRTATRLTSGVRTSTIYDAADQVTNIVHRQNATTILGELTYGYDAAGQRTGLAEQDGSRTTWTYDNAGQLLTEYRTGTAPICSTFAYDPAGNRTLNQRDGATTTFTYDPANQLHYSLNDTGRTTYVFDPAGNQQIVIAPDLSRTTTTWDAENRPVLYALPSGERVTQTFNPDTRRLSKATAEGTTNFVWEPVTDAYLQERDDTDAVIAEFTTEPSAFGPVLSQHRDGTTSDLLTDALGSTRLITDETGTVAGSFIYDAWGSELATAGGILLPFRWVGRWGYYHDPETGNVYVRARTYRPTIARWTSVDPLWPSIYSEFVYVENSPTHFLDPSGLNPNQFGTSPGTFQISMRDCFLSELQLHPGSCCHHVTVRYVPSDLDRGIYRRIEFKQWISERTWFNRCVVPSPQVSLWVSDPQEANEATEWVPDHIMLKMTPVAQSHHFVERTDMPGGDNKGSLTPCLCPGVCSWSRLRQDFIGCVYGELRSGRLERIGCARWWVDCSYSYDYQEEVTYIGWPDPVPAIRRSCLVSSTKTRSHNGVHADIAPFDAVR